MSKMVFDSNISGHHAEYVSHLVEYLRCRLTDEKYYFVVPEEMKIKFPEIISKSEINANIVWEYIPDADVKWLIKLSLINRSFAELALVVKYAKKFSSNHVYLLYFNIFQLALILKRPKFNISGILFLQFLRMNRSSWNEKLKYFRKYWITKLYCKNPSIKSVFVLNDEKSASFLNSEFSTSVFKMLPDPVPEYLEEEGFDVYQHYSISKNRKILLHPGSIDPRKGTLEIIEAVNYLSEEESKEFAILIVGKATEKIDRIIREKLEVLENNSFSIIFDNSFISNERLKSLFMQSYAVLIPYKNSEASSGILGHAAASFKPVIGPSDGLLGSLIRDYNLGSSLRKINPYYISSAFVDLIRIEYQFIYNKESAMQFIKERNPEYFVISLLK